MMEWQDAAGAIHALILAYHAVIRRHGPADLFITGENSQRWQVWFTPAISQLRRECVG